MKAWQDTIAEIKLKKAIERMMVGLKIPTVLIRSINLKKMSALNDLGLKLPDDADRPGDVLLLRRLLSCEHL